MNLRTLTLTIAILAAACGAIWFLQRPAAPVVTDARIGNPVLASDTVTKAAQIKIADQGKTVTLVRQSDGSWHVATYYDLPADFTKLGQLISDLTDAKITRFVTARPDRLARLEFKDTTLTLLESDAKELWTVTLGKNADGGGRFIRFGKEEKGYQFNPSFSFESDSKNWADTTLLALKQDEIACVDLSFADSTIVSAKRAKKEDSWTSASAPAGKRLKPDQITSALGNLVSIRFSDTTAPDDASVAIAKAHSRTVKLTTFAGEAFTITLGRKPEEKKLKPSSPTSPVAGVADPGSSAPTTATPAPAKPPEPEFETVPAGPVYAFISSSNEKAPINDLMKRRAFQIGEWTFNGLPANAADLWEDLPPPSTSEPKKVEPKPAEPAKPKAS